MNMSVHVELKISEIIVNGKNMYKYLKYTYICVYNFENNNVRIIMINCKLKLQILYTILFYVTIMIIIIGI
jgi:hypothetical protein